MSYFYVTIHKTEMDCTISYGIGSVQKRARQRDKKKMPKLPKRKTYLSEIGKAPEKKHIVVTMDGLVRNVSNDNSDGSAWVYYC